MVFLGVAPLGLKTCNYTILFKKKYGNCDILLLFSPVGIAKVNNRKYN